MAKGEKKIISLQVLLPKLEADKIKKIARRLNIPVSQLLREIIIADINRFLIITNNVQFVSKKDITRRKSDTIAPTENDINF